MSLAVSFISTLQYIDDVLSIDNDQFHDFVNPIYSNELETKEKMKCSTYYVIAYNDIRYYIDKLSTL
jgi:hypothetical protein